MGVSDDFTGIASTTLELNWLNVDEFSMYDYSNIDAMAFDNIVVTAVPIPATVWLFGSALAGLGWMRRKKA